jgi:hypothetical protein
MAGGLPAAFCARFGVGVGSYSGEAGMSGSVTARRSIREPVAEPSGEGVMR